MPMRSKFSKRLLGLSGRHRTNGTARYVRVASGHDTRRWSGLEQFEPRLLLSNTAAEASYVTQEWGITGLDPQLIVSTLAVVDARYGTSFGDLVDALLTAKTYGDQIANKKYSDAAATAYNFGISLGGSDILENAGLSGVAAVAGLAAWPIQAGLTAFVNNLGTQAFKVEMQIYFQVRPSYGTGQEIIDAPNDMPLYGPAPYSMKDSQGWVYYADHFQQGPVPGFNNNPVAFFTYAEKAWTVYQAQNQLSS
ncbi:MAG: hypothetical protein WCI73_16035, partial [Phycisphaerae bacterium]